MALPLRGGKTRRLSHTCRVNDDAPSWRNTAIRATLAAIPYAGGTLQVLYDDVRARRATAAGETIDVILEITGELALAQRMEKDPIVEALFVNAVDSAIRTGLSAKRRLLAKVVANAVVDEALVDESHLLAAALGELDAPHVRALKAMADEWRTTRALPSEATERPGGWGTSAIFRNLPEPLKATLVRTGTAKPTPQMLTGRMEPHRADGITDFGLELIEALEQEGVDEDL